VVPGPSREVSPESIRNALKSVLPRYMIPSAIVALDALPLTSSGKVDRRALPASGPAEVERGRASVPPRDDLEARLVALWEDLLGVRPIGVTDDFFDLGGHSLM